MGFGGRGGVADFEALAELFVVLRDAIEACADGAGVGKAQEDGAGPGDVVAVGDEAEGDEDGGECSGGEG